MDSSHIPSYNGNQDYNNYNQHSYQSSYPPQNVPINVSVPPPVFQHMNNHHSTAAPTFSNVPPPMFNPNIPPPPLHVPPSQATVKPTGYNIPPHIQSCNPTYCNDGASWNVTSSAKDYSIIPNNGGSSASVPHKSYLDLRQSRSGGNSYNIPTDSSKHYYNDGKDRSSNHGYRQDYLSDGRKDSGYKGSSYSDRRDEGQKSSRRRDRYVSEKSREWESPPRRKRRYCDSPPRKEYNGRSLDRPPHNNRPRHRDRRSPSPGGYARRKESSPKRFSRSSSHSDPNSKYRSYNYRVRSPASESSNKSSRENSRSRNDGNDRHHVPTESRNHSHSTDRSVKPDKDHDEIKKQQIEECMVAVDEANTSEDEVMSEASNPQDINIETVQEEEETREVWVRSSPADLYYTRDGKGVVATKKCQALCERFQKSILNVGKEARAQRQKLREENGSEESENKQRDSKRGCHSCKEKLKCKSNNNKSKDKKKQMKHCSSDSSSSSSDSSADSSSSGEDSDDGMSAAFKELEKKQKHPDRLHQELWFNAKGEMNDGPLCRCSLKAQRSGIRHGYYVGETIRDPCNQWSNNLHRLHHYLITVSPPTNFLVKSPTVIMHDNHEFIFEGFSLFSHQPLEEVPTCKVIRFNIEYTLLYFEEKPPENFCIKELDLFYEYLFKEILELMDLDLRTMGDDNGCPVYHFYPRFVRALPENGKEVLAMSEVMKYMLSSYQPLINKEQLPKLLEMSQYEWQNYADEVKGMIVTSPGQKPSSVRVDQLDRDQQNKEMVTYPVIVHFGVRPPQLSYAGNPTYQKAWREYVKFRHLLANMPKPSFTDKKKLASKEAQLQEMRIASRMKRDVTVDVSSHGFYKTGIMCDVVQHAMLLPVLAGHLRFHQSLEHLEKKINYTFQCRYLLQLALTHPSYREHFGTNPDHARNSLTNCGIRQPEYGDRRIHYMNTRKRGINTLINIMSRFGQQSETESKITHNERLEFLGDAVVEFLTSIHLFHLFPDLEEGGLATYRAAIVQNQHLAVLAEKLDLDKFMRYAHGSDLCHDFELRHAMANCFEALMGAIFLDSTIEYADTVFGSTLFMEDSILKDIWTNYPPHPLQIQEPIGDRKWIETFPILKKLSEFEESIGVEFKHIRILARAFTDRSVGYNNLTLGSNQRLEFLGDTVLQLVASDYLYRYFPEHHEGHLSLLRSSLVNNRTQAMVCDDLDMTKYSRSSHLKGELKTKDRADLLEAFLGALYIDRGLDYCITFCDVCFFPRLHKFIISQDWNDPKSKLQQCCLTLRTMKGGEPDIPTYKVIECIGPTNTRVYTVAVYFRGKRLAKASGTSIQMAEMNAAKKALELSEELFPQLDHQRRVIQKSVKLNKDPVHKSKGSNNSSSSNSNSKKDKSRIRKREESSERPKRIAVRSHSDRRGRSEGNSRSPTARHKSGRFHSDSQRRHKGDAYTNDKR